MTKVKSVTVAIGLAAKDGRFPVHIAGTGFFVSDKGHIATAGHVVNNALEQQLLWKNSGGVETELVIFYKNSSLVSGTGYYKIPINSKARVKFKKIPENYVGFRDPDLSICKVEGNKIPHLRIKRTRPDLYVDVAMCGYPGTHQVFKVRPAEPMRISPLMQFGKITGFLAEDSHPKPYAIQTDMFSTGGASGSPIVEQHSGEVVAIAQGVIHADISGDADNTAHIGMVYGLSNHLIPSNEEIETGEIKPFEVTSVGPLQIKKLGKERDQ